MILSHLSACQSCAGVATTHLFLPHPRFDPKTLGTAQQPGSHVSCSPRASACAQLPPSLAPRWTSRLVWGHGSPTDRGSRRLMRSVSPPTLYLLAPCSTSFGCAEAVMVAVHVELDVREGACSAASAVDSHHKIRTWRNLNLF